MIGNGVSKIISSGDVSSPDDSFIIVVENGWKTYDHKNYVIKNLSLLIPHGTIYSILGSSGSGKSSILNCIIGNTYLNSGTIQVNISHRNNIGFMPQELALYEDLTIKETFEFFAYLYNKAQNEVESNYNELTTLLEIPSKDTLIKNLSGGQKRRVSLGVSLLNKPKLLVLDEPTVGLDSLLREKIWQYLLRITRNEGRTVIITTHYIQEAKHSDKVCFLKEGKSLLEGSPKRLIEEFKTNSLEEIYFMTHWQDLQLEQSSDDLNNPPSRHKSNTKIFKDENRFSFRRVKAFTTKSLMQIKRNPMMFYICLLMPGLLFMLLREASRPPSAIKLAYINNETNCQATIRQNSCYLPLSCRYLQSLKDNRFITLKYESIMEGLKDVKRNKVWALLYINSNFSQGVIERLEFFATEHHQHQIRDQAVVWSDMSSYVISEMVKRGLHESYLESLHSWYLECGWNAHFVKPVLKLERWIHGKENKAEGINSGAIPGAVILIMYTVSMSVGLIFILTEKETGTFKRCKILGLTSGEMLSSELITSNCMMIPSTILLVCLMHLYWGESRGNPLWILSLLIVQVNTGIINGLLIALMTKNLTLALLVSTGIATVSSYITGVMWPVEGMHWTGQWLNKLLPVSVSVKSMQVITSHGANILNYQVAQGFINSFLWIILFLSLIRIIIWKQSNK